MNLEPRPDPSLLSIVCPIFDEEEVLPLLRKRLDTLAARLPCPVEWLLVDDGSADQTGEILAEWASQDPRAKVIEMSRNFGHQLAITAGLDFAAGDAAVVLDADLQDPPELILEMLPLYRQGYDVVYAQRSARHGLSWSKRAAASLFYWLIGLVVRPRLPPEAGDFRLMSRAVLTALSRTRERQRFVRGLVTWLGFPQAAVTYERPARAAGTTKFSLRKLLELAGNGIFSPSGVVMRLTVAFGFVAFLGCTAAAYLRSRAEGVDPQSLFRTLLALLGALGALLFLGIGMLAEYVGRIHDEVKQRPLYVVRRTRNLATTGGTGRGMLDEQRGTGNGRRDG